MIYRRQTAIIAVIPDDPSTYDPVLYPKLMIPATASYQEDAMLRQMDYYKKYRDLSYIGIAAWYLISILDANVDASLFNFDISDNLDIALHPASASARRICRGRIECEH